MSVRFVVRHKTGAGLRHQTSAGLGARFVGGKLRRDVLVLGQVAHNPS